MPKDNMTPDPLDRLAEKQAEEIARSNRGDCICGACPINNDDDMVATLRAALKPLEPVVENAERVRELEGRMSHILNRAGVGDNDISPTGRLEIIVGIATAALDGEGQNDEGE